MFQVTQTLSVWCSLASNGTRWYEKLFSFLFSSSLSITWNTYDRGKAAVDNKRQMCRAFCSQSSWTARGFSECFATNSLRIDGGWLHLNQAWEDSSSKGQTDNRGSENEQILFFLPTIFSHPQQQKKTPYTAHVGIFSLIFLFFICILKLLYFCCKTRLLMIANTSQTL